MKILISLFVFSNFIVYNTILMKHNMLYANLFRAGIDELKLDSVIIKLNTDTCKANLVNLFPVYLAAGDAVKADSVFTVIKSMGVDSSSYEMTMQSINLRMLRDTITPAELDNITLAIADLFTLNYPEQSFKAKALMRSAKGKSHKRIPYSTQSVNNRSMQQSEDVQQSVSLFEFNIFPNPATENIQIKSVNIMSFNCILYNQTGTALVFQNTENGFIDLDIRKLNQGVYSLVVKDKVNILQVSKVVIIK